MGFAVSLIMFYLGYGKLTPVGSIGIDNVYLMTFLNGLVSACGVWLVHTFQEFIEK